MLRREQYGKIRIMKEAKNGAHFSYCLRVPKIKE